MMYATKQKHDRGGLKYGWQILLKGLDRTFFVFSDSPKSDKTILAAVDVTINDAGHATAGPAEITGDYRSGKGWEYYSPGIKIEETMPF